MNISLIPTIAAPARAGDALPGAAAPGFAGLLATMPLADARIVQPQRSLEPGAAPIDLAAQVLPAEAVAPGVDVLAKRLPPEQSVPDEALVGQNVEALLAPEVEAPSEPPATTQVVRVKSEPQRVPHDLEPDASAQQEAAAQTPVPTNAATADTPPIEAAAVAPADIDTEQGEGAEAAEPDAAQDNSDLPVPPTLPEVPRPAPSGPGAANSTTVAAAAVPQAPEQEQSLPQGDVSAAIDAPAPKAQPAEPQLQATTSIADAGKGNADVAPDGLPSQLFSQSLPTDAARPPAQAYAAHGAQIGREPVVAAKPGQIGRDMGVEIARQVAAGKEEVLVRLDPAEMGRIDVRLSFERDGTLRAVMAADSPMALDMLRREAGDLSRALSDAGVRADPQSFRFDSRSGDASQSWQRGQQGGDGRGEQAGLAHNGGDVIAEEPVYQSLRTSGRVDLMA